MAKKPFISKNTLFLCDRNTNDIRMPNDIYLWNCAVRQKKNQSYIFNVLVI